MTGWPFDGAPKRIRLDPDLYEHAKAGEVRIISPVAPRPVKTLADVLADLARLSMQFSTNPGHADYDFDAPKVRDDGRA